MLTHRIKANSLPPVKRPASYIEKTIDLIES